MLTKEIEMLDGFSVMDADEMFYINGGSSWGITSVSITISFPPSITITWGWR